MNSPWIGRSAQRARLFLARHKLELGLICLLFVLAVLVRVPYLYLVPRWTDEVGESRFALGVAGGTVNPLLGMVTYYGPVHPDLVGLLLWFLPNPLLPRAFNMVLAALTVPSLYLLGRLLNGRLTGLVAALLLLTSSTHIVINSHLAYGSAATPFFSTLACVCLVAAYNKKSAWLLAASGVLLALAMQTHPVAVGIAPGLALWFLLPRVQWAWFRRPTLYLAGVTAVAAYSPVLFDVLAHRSAYEWEVGSRSYAIEKSPTLITYLGNLQNLGVELLRMVGAYYDSFPRPSLYLTDPLILAFAILIPLGLLASLRRGRGLPVFGLASAALIVPVFNRQYDAFPSFTRYVAFLLPLLYLAVGILAADVWNWLRARTLSRYRLRAAGLAGGLLLAALVFFPLERTFGYYDQQTRADSTNAPFLEVVQRIATEGDRTLLLDDSLKAGEFPSGGNLERSFRIWYAFEQRPYEEIKTSEIATAVYCSNAQLFLVATPQAAKSWEASCGVNELLRYHITTRPGRPDIDYGLYEVGPRR